MSFAHSKGDNNQGLLGGGCPSAWDGKDVTLRDPHTRNPVLVDTRPATAMQALMEATPGHEPDTSKEELLDIGDVIADAISDLPERDRYIFNALVVERVSLRRLAVRLSMSKTHMARERDRICAVLREELSEYPIITEYLGDNA